MQRPPAPQGRNAHGTVCNVDCRLAHAAEGGYHAGGHVPVGPATHRLCVGAVESSALGDSLTEDDRLIVVQIVEGEVDDASLPKGALLQAYGALHGPVACKCWQPCGQTLQRKRCTGCACVPASAAIFDILASLQEHHRPEQPR